MTEDNLTRRTVAAALSAAVTSTKPIETAPTLHGRASREKKTSRFPATLRERGSGGEALLLEKRPLPRHSLVFQRLSPQLTAGAVDVVAHFPAAGRGDVVRFEGVKEALHGGLVD